CRAELVGDAVPASENDRDLELSAGHVADVGGVVVELVEGDQGKAPAHELDDRPQAAHRGADAEPAKARLADRRVAYALGPEFGEHSFAHLVRAIVLGDLFAHEKD